jgi:biopolymer transport protein TolQ
MESILVNLVTLADENSEISITALIAKASPIVKGVLGLLVLMSLISWYIIIYKWLSIRRAQKESHLFLETFWQSKRLDEIYQTSEALQRSPISQIFRAGYVELSKLRGGSGRGTDTMNEQLGDIENITRALRRAQNAEVIHLEAMTQFLATTASAAPFVGLFGTVWGIMSSFINIAHKGDATLITVAPGIAEALVATAIGLVAAIPAVAFYNFFVNRIRVLVTDMENFGHDFLNIVKRHFFK